MPIIKAFAKNDCSICESSIKVSKNEIIKIYWIGHKFGSERKDIILNQAIELCIQVKNFVAGTEIILKVKHSKGRCIKGSYAEFNISGTIEKDGLVRIKNFVINCDFNANNLVFGNIEFHYQGKYVTHLCENFGWIFIKTGDLTKVFVNLGCEINYLADGFTKNDYKDAINKQFRRTLEISSNKKITGKIFFEGIHTYELPQVVPMLTIQKKASRKNLPPGQTVVAGGTTYAHMDIRSESIDDGYLLKDLAESAIHELLHTIRVGHPFTVTQSEDCKLIRTISKLHFRTTEKTDKNIYYNIMNYNIIYINDKYLDDLWKTKRAEYLTKGQLNFMLKEIELQMKGAGTRSNSLKFDEYWMFGEYPGERV